MEKQLDQVEKTCDIGANVVNDMLQGNSMPDSWRRSDLNLSIKEKET